MTFQGFLPDELLFLTAFVWLSQLSSSNLCGIFTARPIPLRVLDRKYQVESCNVPCQGALCYCYCYICLCVCVAWTYWRMSVHMGSSVFSTCLLCEAGSVLCGLLHRQMCRTFCKNAVSLLTAQHNGQSAEEKQNRVPLDCVSCRKCACRKMELEPWNSWSIFCPVHAVHFSDRHVRTSLTVHACCVTGVEE